LKLSPSVQKEQNALNTAQTDLRPKNLHSAFLSAKGYCFFKDDLQGLDFVIFGKCYDYTGIDGKVFFVLLSS